MPEGDSISHVPRTNEELAQLEGLVRNGLGISAARGDEITVVGLSFEPLPEIAPPGGGPPPGGQGGPPPPPQ